MSKVTITNFSNRTGSPFQNKKTEEIKLIHKEVLEKTHYELQKEKQSELMQKASKKTPEYQAHRPAAGVFTEVVAHGAFTVKPPKEPSRSPTPPKNGHSKLLGFPSSANDLALDAKTDLESDPNISKEVKEKVIEKLFTLVSMVQHAYEAKVRIMTEFDKYKDTHARNEMKREKEHSEQLYKINMSFQNEVIQAIQRLKSELDISRSLSKSLERSCEISNENANFTIENGQEFTTDDKSGDSDNCDLVKNSESD